MKSAVHFIGVVHPDQGKDAHFEAARRVFGAPDFIHRRYDARAVAEIMPGDTVVFHASVDPSHVNPHAFDDSANV